MSHRIIDDAIASWDGTVEYDEDNPDNNIYIVSAPEYDVNIDMDTDVVFFTGSAVQDNDTHLILDKDDAPSFGRSLIVAGLFAGNEQYPLGGADDSLKEDVAEIYIPGSIVHSDSDGNLVAEKYAIFSLSRKEAIILGMDFIANS